MANKRHIPYGRAECSYKIGIGGQFNEDKNLSISAIKFNVPLSIRFVKVSKSLKSGLSIKKGTIFPDDSSQSDIYFRI